MLELNPEFRHELAAARADALRRCAEPVPPGRLRRAAGSGLVRLGLRLGYDGRVPPFVTQLVTEDGPPAQAGGPSWSPAALRFRASAGVRT
jgi:hypothetical protein